MMRRLVSAAVLAGVVMTGSAVAPASATNIGHEGCTPGYWKNHTDNWQETHPGTPVTKLYQVSAALDGVTVEDALQLHGGPGYDGAERILVRAATSAWLNAAHEGLGFPWRRFSKGLDGRPPLVQFVNDALASGDRDTIIAAASRIDGDNNLGCPLN